MALNLARVVSRSSCTTGLKSSPAMKAGNIFAVSRAAFGIRSIQQKTSLIQLRTTGVLPRAAGRKLNVVSASASAFVELVKDKNEKFPVIVYSKTYCPYCSEVKGLFKRLEVDVKVVELDDIVEGDDVQNALFDITGRGTVPQIFIKGNFIGGCDDTLAAYRTGALKKALADAGVQATI